LFVSSLLIFCLDQYVRRQEQAQIAKLRAEVSCEFHAIRKETRDDRLILLNDQIAEKKALLVSFLTKMMKLVIHARLCGSGRFGDWRRGEGNEGVDARSPL
jgi:hypothetical protein